MAMSDEDEREIKSAVERLTDIAESNRNDIKDILDMLKGDGTIGSGWQGEIYDLKSKVSLLWKIAGALGTAVLAQIAYTVWEVTTKL